MVSSYEPDISGRHPSFSVLQAIRILYRIPLVAFWHDTCGTITRERYAPYINDSFDLHVLIDSDQFTLHFPTAEVIRLMPPADPHLFYPQKEHDIEVSFVGSIAGHRSIRADYIDYLKQRNIPMVIAGGQVGNSILSWEEYASIIKRSKISLNFSESVDGERQVKARVLEALCSGSLLLESENPETSRFFEPMREYVPCTSPEDMHDKIRYYLANESERNAIAMNGYYKATACYNGNIFWIKILNRLRELGHLRDIK
jgi:glycosyltransferase involved in cell wall biosynthesis